jgi:hypothetical protein
MTLPKLPPSALSGNNFWQSVYYTPLEKNRAKHCANLGRRRKPLQIGGRWRSAGETRNKSPRRRSENPKLGTNREKFRGFGQHAHESTLNFLEGRMSGFTSACCSFAQPPPPSSLEGSGRNTATTAATKNKPPTPIKVVLKTEAALASTRM